MRISDWSSDVCSSDLAGIHQDCPPIAPHVVELRFEVAHHAVEMFVSHRGGDRALYLLFRFRDAGRHRLLHLLDMLVGVAKCLFGGLEELLHPVDILFPDRSEEHTSELQSLMRNSYAVFCLKKKK